MTSQDTDDAKKDFDAAAWDGSSWHITFDLLVIARIVKWIFTGRWKEVRDGDRHRISKGS